MKITRGFSVPFLVNISGRTYGELAELVDALDLGSSAARRKGSSPLFPTNRARGPGLTNTSIFSVSYETLGGWQLHQNINKLRLYGPLAQMGER